MDSKSQDNLHVPHLPHLAASDHEASLYQAACIRRKENQQFWESQKDLVVSLHSMELNDQIPQKDLGLGLTISI